MYTWNGASAGSSDWSDAGNWVNQLSPYGDPNGQLVFDGTIQTTNTLDQNLSANSLTLASTAGSFAVSGAGALTLGSGGITNNSSNAQTFNAPLVLSAAQTWTNNGGTLKIAGTIDNGGFGLKTSGSMTISGAITGTGSLTTQSGLVTLTGNNSYSGGTTVNGILFVGNGGTTGSITGDAVVNSDLLFNRSDAVTYSGVLSGTGIVDMSGTGSLTLTGGTNSSTLPLEMFAGTTNIGTSMKFAEAIVSGSTMNVNTAGQTLTLDSAGLGLSAQPNPGGGIVNVTNSAALVTPSVSLAQGAALNISSGGTVTTASLSGNGTVTLDNGGLALTQTGSNSLGFTLNSGGGSVDVASGQNATFNGAIGGTGILTKTGAGTLVLAGSNSYGGTTISAGTLQLAGSLSGDVTNNAALVFAGSGSATISGAITGTGSLTAQSGFLTLLGNNNYSGGTTVNSIVFVGNGGTTGSITGDAVVNSDLLFYRSDAVTYSGVLSGTGIVDMSGTGSLTLTGATNSSTLPLEMFAGTTNIGASMKFAEALVSGSTLNVNSAGQTLTLDSAGLGLTVQPGQGGGIVNVTNGAALVTPTVSLAQGAALNISGGGRVSAGSFSGAGTVTLDGGTLAQTQTGSNSLGFTLNSGGGTVDVASGQTATVTGAVGGSGSFTKTGSGALDLNGANSYTGNTYVQGGSLVVSQPLQHDDSGHVFVAVDPGGAASNGAAFTVAGLQGASYAGIGSTEIGGDGLSADLLFGTSPVGTPTSVTMSWNPGANGDILNLSGMEISDGAPGQTDLFVLQMSYNPGDLSLFDQDALSLDYFDGAEWVNAIDGNIGANLGGHFLGAWTNDAAHDALGAWGVDTTNDVVWAVLDHNSEFASFSEQGSGAAPEPGSVWLLGVGAGLGLVVRRLTGNSRG